MDVTLPFSLQAEWIEHAQTKMVVIYNKKARNLAWWVDCTNAKGHNCTLPKPGPEVHEWLGENLKGAYKLVLVSIPPDHISGGRAELENINKFRLIHDGDDILVLHRFAYIFEHLNDAIHFKLRWI
jgi:hypothetical protein